jgi:quercetin dioxygenase-like cupin family protein
MAIPAALLKQFTRHERFDALKFEAEDAEVYVARYPAGTAIEPHHHDSENYGIITRGELVLITNGQESRFGVGQWYHLKPNQIHAARFEQETEEIEFWFKKNRP